MTNFVTKDGVTVGKALKRSKGTVTGNATLDLSSGNSFEHTATADVTVVFSNPPATNKGYDFTLKITGELIDNSYDLANAEPPAYGRFSVAAQNTFPQDMFFKPDGTKFYTIDADLDNVNEYSLSSAWDISTASYVQNFSVSSQDVSPQGIFFKDDGTKMYILGGNGLDVNEYSLSSAWDISTASYVQNFSISAQESAPNGIFFGDNGAKMYIVGSNGDDVNQYSLSSAWDISTASYVQNFSVSTQDTIPVDVLFKDDGTKMYVVGASGVDINEYSLSSAWDISTASYVQNFSVSAQEGSPRGLSFKTDGTKMYLCGVSTDAVYSYTLTSAWDISSASFDFPTTGYFSVAAQETGPSGVFFKPDGAKMYIIGVVGQDVNEYNLSTAWEVSTASYVQNFSVSAQETQPSALFFKPDGTKMYITGESGDDVNEYSLSSAWDISTASYVQNFSIATEQLNPYGLFFKADGTKMYVVGRSGAYISEYNLSTPWDISTASHVQNFIVSNEDTFPSGVFFKPDGTKMYVSGLLGDDINEYSLSTAWDVSTASYIQNFSVSAQDTSPADIFFGDNGTKMYITGSTSDAVWQYTTGTYGDATFTYPASVKWPAGTPPAAPADGETDLLEFYTDDAGTTYYGVRLGDDMS